MVAKVENIYVPKFNKIHLPVLTRVVNV